MNLADYIYIFIICLAPSLFFLLYFREKDWRKPEPTSYLIYSFSAGMFAAPCALLLFEILEGFSPYEDLKNIAILSEDLQFAYAMFAIGPIEEMAKFTVLYISVFGEKEFDSPMDAIIYSATVSLGFATIENWYFMIHTKEILVTRAITLPFNHILFSSFFAYGMGKSMIEKSGSFFIVMGIFLSSIYHGLYDFILFNDYLPDYLILPMVLILWIWLSYALKEFAEFDEKSLGVKKQKG